MLLESIISQSSFDNVLTQATPVQNILELTVDVTPDSIYWVNPYLSSDFPEITCDKKYFFLYSTDHDDSVGGIYWGKADNLDGSDFVELGLIISGSQAETPFLYRFPEQSERIYLYYHTNRSEIGNGNVQRTRLITTTGGLLHTATWTDRGRPLGFEAGDAHNGYFRFWDYNSELRGVHYKGGNDTPIHQKSTLASDGFSVTRGETFLHRNLLADDLYYLFPFGEFFTLFGQLWWIGDIDYVFSERPADPFMRRAICKCSDIFEISEFIGYINSTPEFGYESEIYIEGTTAHIYTKNGFDTDATHIQYSTFDLSQLYNYL